MATVETWTPSRRIQAAALAEHERVEREIAKLDARARELAAELATVEAARAELEHQRAMLNHFTDGREPPPAQRADRQLRALPDPQASGANGGTLLKGAQIRETAVRILAAKHEPEQPVHYRDWFALLTAQGFMPGGKDPLATFLTQIGRSPVVSRSTTAGMYVLDHGFIDRARQRLAALAADLSATQDLPPTATVQQIASARERRTRLTGQMQDIERQLQEAIRSLGDG